LSLLQITNVVVIVQVCTFITLTPLLIATGSLRLGLAQGLLGIVTWLVYWS
jgi:hypothetical protein